MAYQVLARKWRPKSFSNLKGQEHVTRALENAIARNQLHHAYLFTGTRGVGKTTIARILAKSLNCESGITPQPCGKCGACTAIDAGHFVDLIEVDAASRTRVEDTRELLDNVQYAPTQGRFKIYLIDEVHMLSGHSFNALLKTLEEPPEHVKFILATTDPERIPITVLSRCLRFTLKAIPQKEIVAQLEIILQTEGILFEPQALSKIARAASGSMRDALSLLEQAIAYCEDGLKTMEVEEMLGMSYQRHLPSLLSALATLDVKQSLHIIEEMSICGADFVQVLASILDALHAVAIAQIVPHDLEEAGELLKGKLTPEEVQLLYQIGLMGQRDLNFAPDVRIGFEMTLLRMMVFRPVDEAVPPMPVTPVKVAVMTAPDKAVAASPLEPKTIAVSPSLPNPEPTTQILNWDQLIPKLGLSGLSSIIVKHCVLTSWDGQKLDLALDDAQKACLSPAREEQIKEALSHYFGRPIKMRIIPGEVQDTPMMKEKKRQDARQKEVKQAVDQDQGLQNMISTFGATVEKITPVKQD